MTDYELLNTIINILFLCVSFSGIIFTLIIELIKAKKR